MFFEMSTCDLPFGGSKAEMIRGIKEKPTPKLDALIIFWRGIYNKNKFFNLRLNSF